MTGDRLPGQGRSSSGRQPGKGRRTARHQWPRPYLSQKDGHELGQIAHPRPSGLRSAHQGAATPEAGHQDH